MLRKRGPVLVLSFLLAACSQVDLYRTETSKVCDLSEISDDAAPKECWQSALERTKDFEIAYVEFSDQGWLHSRDQLTHVLDLVRKPDERDLQIVAFVHGWKHSAKFDDLDVREFRRNVLPAFARKHPRARTVGITFYDRKSTAEHVARGSVRELFSQLRAIRGEKAAAARNVSLVLIGHSFGGLILYNAIAESTLDYLVAARNATQSPAMHADLVVLLNPAFEASRFEPLFQVAKDGLSNDASSKRYAKDQRPVLVSITSEGDRATGVAFPIGRRINSVFDHEGWTDQDDPSRADYAERLEKIANTHTMGHMERYRTHRLTLSPDASGRAGVDTSIACSPVQNKLLATETRFPLWNMYASRQVIKDHHDIYGKNLWEFISALSDRSGDLSELCKGG